jgi:crossover junction endodeoxyribonuclease RuvC
MRVLGVDPGTIRMGMGLLEGNGNRYTLVAFESVKLSASRPLPERLKEIYETVHDFIERHRPEVLALENVFFGKDVRALVKIGEARASAMLAAANRGIPVVEYPPARVKQAVSGNGQASKIQIQQMMKHLLRLKEPPPVDAADALAVALCHLQTAHVRIPVG